jgi:hypothetical protein
LINLTEKVVMLARKNNVVRFCYFVLAALLVVMISCARDNICSGTEFEVQALSPFQTTGMNVNKDDTIVFFARGTWTVGLGYVGPGGGKNDLCSCAVNERDIDGIHYRGILGALIGKIGDGKPFIIGAVKRVISPENGTIYLGANDNMAPCDGINTGSCYNDNKGAMIVCVKIKTCKK